MLQFSGRPEQERALWGQEALWAVGTAHAESLRQEVLGCQGTKGGPEAGASEGWAAAWWMGGHGELEGWSRWLTQSDSMSCKA